MNQDPFNKPMDRQTKEIAALRAEVAALREDKARLDWLEKHCDGADKAGYGLYTWWELLYNDGNRVESPSIRKAIDDARRKA